MKKLIALSLCLIMAAELLVLIPPDRRYASWLLGAAVGVALLSVRYWLTRDISAAPEVDADQPGESLRSWRNKTETMIRWSQSSRSDWDRHLRPVLARRFDMAIGHAQAKDPAAFAATGRMLFGAQLWDWVDPNNVSHTGAQERGPGRQVLADILQRLEQV